MFKSNLGFLAVILCLLCFSCATLPSESPESDEQVQVFKQGEVQVVEQGGIVQKGYVARSTIWATPNIPVCWEDQDIITNNQEDIQGVHTAVQHTWEAFSRVRFIGWGMCQANSTGIRIQVIDDQPLVKRLGNRLNGVQNGMVLNFWFNNWSNATCSNNQAFCRDVVAVHEFGHALGFAHEQNRPDAPDWCKDQVQGTPGDVTVGEWDLNSVMNYCNPTWNNNGNLSAIDILTVQSYYGQAYPWPFNGISDPISPGAINGNPDNVQVGDFNGDGRSDLMFHWRASGTNRMYLGTQEGGFTEVLDPIIPNAIEGSPHNLVIADLNGDGNDDAFFHWRDSGRSRLLLGFELEDGQTRFAGFDNIIATTAINGFPDNLVVGDFNGNGEDDLLIYWRSSGTNKLFSRQAN